eukprot:GHVS01019415.1.p1 GENE.GHVS01019415.1~~GHVS01019415.1.p1  ORF type:complete len:128 (-),score=31.18 GHVS01019415.1:922-1305(-)
MAPPSNLYSTRTLGTANAIINPTAAAAAAARSKRRRRRTSNGKSKNGAIDAGDVEEAPEGAEIAEEDTAAEVSTPVALALRGASSFVEQKELRNYVEGGKKNKMVRKGSGKQFVRRLGNLQQPNKVL